MPRTLARTAGIVGLLLLGLIITGDVEADTGGHALPQPVRSIALIMSAVCVIVYWTNKLIEGAILGHARAHAAAPQVAQHIDEEVLACALSRVNLDTEAMRMVIKDAVHDMFGAALEEKMNEVYRLGMVSGAAHYARPYVVPSAEGGE